MKTFLTLLLVTFMLTAFGQTSFKYSDTSLKVNQIHTDLFVGPLDMPSLNFYYFNKLLLDSILTFLQKNNSVCIKIEIHSAVCGSAKHNYDRTEAFAEGISNFLIDRGVDKNRWQITPLGEKYPIVKVEDLRKHHNGKNFYMVDINNNQRLKIIITKT